MRMYVPSLSFLLEWLIIMFQNTDFVGNIFSNYYIITTPFKANR